MYHIFFIHLPVGGHLACFHILSIVNNTVLSIRVHVSFQMRFFCFVLFCFFGYVPRSGITGHIIVLFLVF